MRQFRIATQTKASKATLLELEIQLEKARSRKLSADQEIALLQRIRQGDAEAVPLLVNSWQVHVLSIVRQYLGANTRVAETVSLARKALTQLAESELNVANREHFTRFGHFAIRQSILLSLGILQPHQSEALLETNTATHEALNTQIPFLNKLNDLLLQVETNLATAIEKRLQHLYQEEKLVSHYTDEVVTEATVQWYLKGETNPVHACWLFFRYESNMLRQNVLPLLSGATSNYRKSHLPQLSQPYCYLLYHLLEKAGPPYLFFDFIYRYSAGESRRWR